MDNPSIARILIAVIFFNLLFDYLTNAAIIQRSSVINDPVKIDDPNKRYLDKEKLKIYRLTAEHIGPRNPALKTSNDSSKYDSIEFEEKKINAVHKVVTSFPEIKESRSIGDSPYLHHPNQRSIQLMNNSNGLMLTGLGGNIYQSKKSLRMLEIGGLGLLNRLKPPAKHEENSGRYKIPHTGFSNIQPLELPSSKVYVNTDQEDDDELGSDYDASDEEVERQAKIKPNQMQTSTKVYENAKSYGNTEVYKGYFSESYKPTKIYNERVNDGHVPKTTFNERDNKKVAIVHDYDEEENNHDYNSRTFEQFIPDNNLKMFDNRYGNLERLMSIPRSTTANSFLGTRKVGNNTYVRFINNTGGETIIEDGSLEIDVKTDPSSGKLNFRFQPGQGPNISLKIERKSLVVPIPSPNIDDVKSNINEEPSPNINEEMSQPLLKYYNSRFPWKMNNNSGDINMDVEGKHFQNVESRNAIFYFGDETKHPERRDLQTSFVHIVKSNVIAVSFIAILSLVIVLLCFHACFVVGMGTKKRGYSKLDRNDHSGHKSEITGLWNACKYYLSFTPFVKCIGSNPFGKKTQHNKDSEAGNISRKETTKKIKDEAGNKIEDANHKTKGNQKPVPTTINNEYHDDSEVPYPEDSAFSAPLREILHSNLENTGQILEDSDSDFDPPPRPKRGKSNRFRRRSIIKMPKLRPPDLESIISHDADQSTDDDSPKSNWKPDPENLKMKVMTTGEIREIDEMLVGQNWNRHVYGPHHLKAPGAKGVTFAVLGDATQETSKDLSSISATTKESTRSLEDKLVESLSKAEDVHSRPHSKK